MKNTGVLDSLRIYISLFKLRIVLLSTFSSITGYLLVNHRLSTEMVFLAAGVFLLAGGSCALNQYQERTIDALMRRTKDRPLPAEKVTPQYALLLSLAFVVGGLSVLSCVFGRGPSVIALFTIFWYNGVYTYLKRKSAFAVVPGGLVGAAPPIIGYIAGGGSLSDFRIWALSFFIFMWQIPHFWLLLIDHAEEYKSAGLPTLERFSRKQIERLISQWLLATALSCQLLSVFVASSLFAKCLVLSFSFLFVVLASGLVNERIRSYATAFRIMNMVFFAALLILFGDGLSRILHLPMEKMMARL